MRANFSNGRINGFGHLGLRQLARQEFFDNHDLGALALGQIKAPPLFVGARAFLALLGHLAQNRQDLAIGHAFVIAIAARINITVFDRGIDQPKG